MEGGGEGGGGEALHTLELKTPPPPRSNCPLAVSFDASWASLKPHLLLGEFFFGSVPDLEVCRGIHGGHHCQHVGLLSPSNWAPTQVQCIADDLPIIILTHTTAGEG
jgi:hypothetical protein